MKKGGSNITGVLVLLFLPIVLMIWAIGTLCSPRGKR